MDLMPDRQTRKRARKDRREGKSPSTQAGEFVREEMHHVREGKHGASSPQQVVAIGLSKARRAGVAVRASRGASAETREKAERDVAIGKRRARRKARRRARAVVAVVKAKVRRGKRVRARATKRGVRRAKLGAARAKIGKARTRRSHAT
jgi:hypothetical protein